MSFRNTIALLALGVISVSTPCGALPLSDFHTKEGIIFVEIAYDPATCSDEYPLLITTANLTSRILLETRVTIYAQVSGYQTPVYLTPTINDEHALASGDVSTSCWSIDGFAWTSSTDFNPSQFSLGMLQWSIEVYDVRTKK